MANIASDGSGNLQEALTNVAFGAAISPTALAANTDNYSPTGLQNTTVIRQDVSNAGAGVNLTGIVAQANLKMLVLMNISSTSDNMVLKHNVTSTAANRFFGPNSADVTLRPNGFVILLYDQVSSRWRIMGA